MLRRVLWMSAILLGIAALVQMQKQRGGRAAAADETAEADWEAEGGAPAPSTAGS